MFPSVSLRSTPLRQGSSIGKYEVVRPLARGGMAELYLVKSHGLHKFESLCVLKRLPPHYLVSNPNIVNMFLDEAQLTASVRHPNVAHVFDFGEDHESYFFVMEYIEGQSVAEVLQKCFSGRTRVPIAVAVEIAMGLAEALAAAHEATDADGRSLDLVHRDVSPQNVLLTKHGGVKLIDFGIARARRRREVTQAGHIKGKFSYMSPEQCLAVPATLRTDLYSLGIILYELTTMRRPHGNINGPELLYARSCVDPADPRDIIPNYPEELAQIVHRLLKRNPLERFASAREVHDALMGFARSSGLLVSPFAVSSWVESLDAPVARGSGSWTATTAIPVANEERPKRAMSQDPTSRLRVHDLALRDTQRANVTLYDVDVFEERDAPSAERAPAVAPEANALPTTPPPPPASPRASTVALGTSHLESVTSGAVAKKRSRPSTEVSGRRIAAVTLLFLVVFVASLAGILAWQGLLDGIIVDVVEALPI